MLSAALALQAQADYKMYAQVSLEPKLDQITLFEKNLVEHIKKYHSEGFSSNSNRDVAFAGGFKTWASLDEKSTFKKDFDEAHGEGSQGPFLEEYRASFNSYEDELSIRAEHLGGVQQD